MQKKLTGSSRMPNVVGMYSGLRCGEIGAERAGWLNLYSCDIEQIPADVFYKNNPHGLFEVRDATKLTGDEILSAIQKHGWAEYISNGVDCVLSTSSCKKVSRTNPYREALSVESYAMVDQLRVIREIQPATFVIENVDSFFDDEMVLLKTEFEAKLSHMKNYDTIVGCLNAADYGARQKRKRLIAIGVRDDIGVKASYPSPIPIDYSKVGLATLFPTIDGFATGQSVKRYKTGGNIMFGTLTASDETWVFEYGKRRRFILEERLRLVELEGYDLSPVAGNQKWQMSLTGNGLPPSLATAIFRHLKEEILYKSPTWR